MGVGKGGRGSRCRVGVGVGPISRPGTGSPGSSWRATRRAATTPGRGVRGLWKAGYPEWEGGVNIFSALNSFCSVETFFFRFFSKK